MRKISALLVFLITMFNIGLSAPHSYAETIFNNGSSRKSVG